MQNRFAVTFGTLSICPRSLFHFYIVSILRKLDKTSWTYSSMLHNIYTPVTYWNQVTAPVIFRQWYNRIDQTVLLGALPFRSQYTEQVEARWNIGLIFYDLVIVFLVTTHWFSLTLIVWGEGQDRPCDAIFSETSPC